MGVILESDRGIDLLKCPKCKALWRARGYYDFDIGGWVYDEDNADLCPCGCRNIFGLRIRADVVIPKKSHV